MYLLKIMRGTLGFFFSYMYLLKIIRELEESYCTCIC